MTARDEILEAARHLTDSDRAPFSPSDLLTELRRRGTTYPESTLRTHIVSVMCLDAPENHAIRYPDLERVGRGQYRLADTAGGPPMGSGRGPVGRNKRGERRDRELQLSVLEELRAQGGGSRVEAFGVRGEDLPWQTEDLMRRGYVRFEADGHDSVRLTRAGVRAVEHGFPAPEGSRRDLLRSDELEHLHQLMWDAADEVDGESRRRHTAGIKWMLEEHFSLETADGGGPHGRARKDALGRLESIGAIEQVGGGAAKRTSTCWVTDPGMVQYPW